MGGWLWTWHSGLRMGDSPDPLTLVSGCCYGYNVWSEVDHKALTPTKARAGAELSLLLGQLLVGPWLPTPGVVGRARGALGCH